MTVVALRPYVTLISSNNSTRTRSFLFFIFLVFVACLVLWISVSLRSAVFPISSMAELTSTEGVLYPDQRIARPKPSMDAEVLRGGF